MRLSLSLPTISKQLPIFNTKMISSDKRYFASQESLIHGQPLMLNIYNSFKQEVRKREKTKKLNILIKQLLKIFNNMNDLKPI
jgi:hypothetical protein